MAGSIAPRLITGMVSEKKMIKALAFNDLLQTDGNLPFWRRHISYGRYKQHAPI